MEATDPLKGIQRCRSAIAHLGTGRIHDPTAIVKESVLHREEIDVRRQLFRATFFNPSIIFQDVWELWTGLITGYQLYELAPFAQRVIIVGILNGSAVKTPIDISHLEFAEIHAFDLSPYDKGILVLIWQSSLCW